MSEAGKPFRARQSAIAAAFAAIVLGPVVSPAAPAKSAGTAVAAAAGRSTPARAAVEAEIARAARASGGEVGVLARHLESGLTLSLNENEAFPMASTFKIPIAVQLLTRIDKGDGQVVLVNNICRHATRHDFAEDALGDHSPGSRSR